MTIINFLNYIKKVRPKNIGCQQKKNFLGRSNPLYLQTYSFPEELSSVFFDKKIKTHTCVIKVQMVRLFLGVYVFVMNANFCFRRVKTMKKMGL